MSDTQTSEWIEHDGKGMPVDGDALVRVKYRGMTSGAEQRASFWDSTNPECNNWKWANFAPQADIIAYSVVKP